MGVAVEDLLLVDHGVVAADVLKRGDHVLGVVSLVVVAAVVEQGAVVELLVLDLRGPEDRVVVRVAQHAHVHLRG